MPTYRAAVRVEVASFVVVVVVVEFEPGLFELCEFESSDRKQM